MHKILNKDSKYISLEYKSWGTANWTDGEDQIDTTLLVAFLVMILYACTCMKIQIDSVTY